MYLSKYIFILAGILMMAGCYPDAEESTEIIIKPVRKTIIASANVVINVTDENGQTLTGLTARFNKESKIINQASFFQFEAKDISKENELLTITDKDGEVFEFALYNIENQVNYHHLTLFRNTLKINFITSEGSIISFPSGKINIDLTNTEFKSGNESFAGNVNCIYHEFDLSNPFHLQALPGGKLIDINGKYSLVEWLHVFRFDLLTQNEKYLTLASPKNVLLNISPKTPAHIIQYDRIKKTWMYHGLFSDKQTLPVQSSGIYAVVHLHEPATIKGVFTGQGLPFVKQPVVYYDDGETIQRTLTTNNGNWEILVPKNKNIFIYPEAACVGQNHSIVFNAVNETNQVGTKNFDIPELKQIKVKGKFKDCNAQSLSNGFIKIQNGPKTEYIYIPETDFEWQIPLCVAGPLSFGSAGINGEKMSDIRFQTNTAEMGNIFLCQGLENQYISLRTPGGNTMYSGDISVTDQNGIYKIHFKSTAQEFLLTFKNNEQSGSLAPSEGNILWKDTGFISKGIEINCPTSNTCGFEEILVLSYQKNGWIKGSFKGNFWAKTLQPLTAKNQQIEADFFVKL